VPCPHCHKHILLYRSNYTFNSRQTHENIKPKLKAEPEAPSKIIPAWQKTLTNFISFILILIFAVRALAILYNYLHRENSSPTPVQTTQVDPAQPGTKPSPTQEAKPAPTQTESKISNPPLKEENYDWNITETDASKNGNIDVAVNWLLRAPAIRDLIIHPDPNMMAGTPLNFLGKAVGLTGTVAEVRDYPAGGDKAIGGKESSSIIVKCADGTLAVSLCLKKAGGYVRVGDTVSLYGYLVGKLEQENQLVGKETELVLVGNDYDNWGPSTP